MRDISKNRQVIFQETKEFGDLMDTENLFQKFLPKQTEINKILKVIQRQY